MAQYFHEDAGLKNKLSSMVWGVEEYRGNLFGKIECSLKEEMTPAEEEILKDYIAGQNSDGWGEHFEQCPIDTEDGDLYVSFWNSGDDYAIMTQDELDEYIESQIFWSPPKPKAAVYCRISWRKMCWRNISSLLWQWLGS